MATAALNKASLNRERANLKSYERYLPSLELKRQQLMAEELRARRALAATDAETKRLMEVVAGMLPMLGDEQINVSGLVVVERVALREENLLGIRVPAIESIDFRVPDYSYLAKPHWVDRLVEGLRRSAELRLRRRIDEERLRRLKAAVTKLTQRVNLFEKVLIPRTRETIQRIRIFLSDAERAAVVRSKIAKRMHERLGEDAAAVATAEGLEP